MVGEGAFRVLRSSVSRAGSAAAQMPSSVHGARPRAAQPSRGQHGMGQPLGAWRSAACSPPPCYPNSWRLIELGSFVAPGQEPPGLDQWACPPCRPVCVLISWVCLPGKPLAGPLV